MKRKPQQNLGQSQAHQSSGNNKYGEFRISTNTILAEAKHREYSNNRLRETPPAESNH